MDNPYFAREDAFSSYEIWVNKSDYLPFRYKRTVPHETSWLINNKTEYNIGNLEDFEASNYASIPLTRQLAQDYELKDLEVVSIETWSNDIDNLMSYYEKNELNYKYLLSTEEVKKSYQINEVPTFFILDEKRIIRKVILGYGEETTDKEIRDAIKELI